MGTGAIDADRYSVPHVEPEQRARRCTPPGAQADKRAYSRFVKLAVEDAENLSVRQETVVGLEVEGVEGGRLKVERGANSSPSTFRLPPGGHVTGVTRRGRHGLSTPPRSCSPPARLWPR